MARRMKKKQEVPNEDENVGVVVDEPIDLLFHGTKGDVNVDDVISKDELYTVTKKRKDGNKFVTEKRTLIKRDGIRKIAEAAGILTKFEKKLIIEPSVTNRYMIAFDVTVTDGNGRETTMLGEASDENTKGISKMYKGLTAERRGWSRAVLVHVGLTGVYGEDEFIQEDEIADEENIDKETSYDSLSHDSFKEIVPFVNAINASKSKSELRRVIESISSEKDKLSKEQKDYLNKLIKKNLIKLDDIDV